MPNEREHRALAGLLRQDKTWPRPGASGLSGDACPDAEVLAAFFEHTLPDAERDAVEAHLSLCAHCAETLATLARAEEALRAAQAAEALRARGGERWTWLDWRWLAPLGAAAAAFVLYVAVRPPSVLTPEDTRVSQTDEFRKEPAAAGGAKSDSREMTKTAPASAPSGGPMIAAAPPAEGAGARDALTDLNKQAANTRSAEIVVGAKTPAAAESASPAARANTAQPANAPENRATENRNARVEEFAAQRNQANAQGGLASKVAPAAAAKPAETQAGLRVQDAVSEGKLAAQNAPAPPAPPAQTPPAAVAQEGAATGRSGVVVQQRAREMESARSRAPEPADQDAKKKEAGRYRADERAADRAADKDQARRGFAEMERADASAVGLQIRSADGALMWRANAAGDIEVSKDSGATWTKQFAAKALLVMGVTPEARVCWMASRSGVIVRTEDGETWLRASAPPGETIASLNATSRLGARITTSSGRTYETRDGGRTWQQR